MDAAPTSLERALTAADAALAQAPRDAARRWDRARALFALGRDREALQAYVNVLEIDPNHFDALTSLGVLLAKTGQRNAARTALTRALQVRPDSASAHTNLANLLCDEDAASAREHYERALLLDPNDLPAHRGLAILLLRMGQREIAQRHGEIGFRGRADAWPYRGEGKPISILLVLSALGGNVPIESFVDDRVFLKWTLAPEFCDPDAELPPHDLVFNGVGDADRCREALDRAAAALARTEAPVLNRPSCVRETGRAANAERLGRIPGVVTAHMREWRRDSLMAPGAADALVRDGFRWPILLRALGFHTGEHFVHVDDAAALPSAVDGLPGEDLLILQFINTRSPDGFFRKYRVMIVDGQLYPLHLAVSANWKVHYFSGDMAESAAHRAEDEAFLQDMPGVLGPQAMQTLEAVRDDLGLDYGGIDFALDDRGQVTVFEANATMVIVSPSNDERWAYRVEPVERVRSAVTRMLLARSCANSERKAAAACASSRVTPL
jgi:hypothetical protein